MSKLKEFFSTELINKPEYKHGVYKLTDWIQEVLAIVLIGLMLLAFLICSLLVFKAGVDFVYKII